MLPECPAELRALQPFLQRASELRGREPLVAYHCALYAATLAMTRGYAKTPETNAFVRGLLELLEREKTALGADTLADEGASKRAIVGIAMRIFGAADAADRGGTADVRTARLFLVSSHFMEVLRVFSGGEPTAPEVEERMRYARWRASEIARAVNEGRVPEPPTGDAQPGDGGDQVGDHGDSNDARSFKDGDAKERSHVPHSGGAADQPAPSHSAHVQSPPAQPVYPTLHQPPAVQSPPTQPAYPSAYQPPAGLQSPPTQPAYPSNYHTPAAQSPPTEPGYPSVHQPPSNPSPHAQPSNPSNYHTPAVQSPPTQPGYPSAHQPPAVQSPPSAPSGFQSAQPHASAPPPSATSNIPPSATPSATRAKAPRRPQDMAEAEKLARHGVSAILFDDVPTAVRNLEAALAILRPML